MKKLIVMGDISHARIKNLSIMFNKLSPNYPVNVEFTNVDTSYENGIALADIMLNSGRQFNLTFNGTTSSALLPVLGVVYEKGNYTLGTNSRLSGAAGLMNYEIVKAVANVTGWNIDRYVSVVNGYPTVKTEYLPDDITTLTEAMEFIKNVHKLDFMDRVDRLGGPFVTPFTFILRKFFYS